MEFVKANLWRWRAKATRNSRERDPSLWDRSKAARLGLNLAAAVQNSKVTDAHSRSTLSRDSRTTANPSRLLDYTSPGTHGTWDGFFVVRRLVRLGTLVSCVPICLCYFHSSRRGTIRGDRGRRGEKGCQMTASGGYFCFLPRRFWIYSGFSGCWTVLITTRFRNSRFLKRNRFHFTPETHCQWLPC